MITTGSQPKRAEVEEIFRVTSGLSELTPRPFDTLIQLASEGRLAVVYVDGALAGWTAVERLTGSLSELGMVYVRPEFRSAGVFEALIREVAKRPERLLLATYTGAIMRYATKVWRSREIGLGRAILLSHGQFLFKRLNSQSRESIQGRMATAKPRYAIVERH